MTDDELAAALDRAHEHALRWRQGLDDRPVPAVADADAVAAALGRNLSREGLPADEVVDLLAAAAEPGLVGMPSSRFFGFVVGGTHPAALAADWLVTAWDQNAAMRKVTPATAAIEDVAGRWLVDLLGLPAGSSVGFTTGATMANLAGLAAGRDALLRRAGWDATRGLAGGPAIRVLAGRERHDAIDLVLRFLGLPAPELVEVDDQGRIRPDDLAARLTDDVPTLVALQAGNVHSGAFDPFEECVALAHAAGAWVHVDGAFGLWAAAAKGTRALTTGMALADSWATDAHKTLNVPYDCGVVIVRDPAALTAAMTEHGDYLIQDTGSDPFDRVPEFSRRARGVPVWAVLRALGSDGVADLVDGLCRHARAFADGIADIPGAQVLHDVVFTQVCASFGDDERTVAVVDRMLADGTAWTTGSRWQDRAVLRISVSNWSTTDTDVATTLQALRRAAGH